MAVPDLYRTLWRHRYLIVVLTLIATATGWFRASAQPKVYKAATLVAIQQRVTDPSQAGNAIGVAQHLAQTYAQIVSTYAMGTRVYNQLGQRVPRGAIDISAEPVQDLELLYISAKARDPQVAAAVANAAPIVLRQFVAATGTLHDQIVTVNPAGVPGTPISPHPKRLAILVFLIAFIFNCALALVIEFLSDRLPDADDIEAALGKPVLATVPKLVLKPASVESRAEQAPGVVVARRTTEPRPSSRTGRSVG
jgi:capsular polysaccharide biosynthesis protein